MIDFTAATGDPVLNALALGAMVSALGAMVCGVLWLREYWRLRK